MNAGFKPKHQRLVLRDGRVSWSAFAFDMGDVACTEGDRVDVVYTIDAGRSDRPIRGAAVDSRLVEPGQLFVALPGERTDGHRHLGDAVKRGATALLVTRQIDDVRPYGDVSIIRVADGLAALGAVAAAWRGRFDPLVVGITGSTAALATMFAGNLMVWAAGLLGVTIVLGLVGFFVGKATE